MSDTEQTQQLAKAYEPGDIESRWREHWETEKTFTPSEADLERARNGAPTYSIVIPPPNVTGKLHIGHALNHTLQDILCRHRRQMGDVVLWVPGMDHAGIATQNVVERKLAAEGLSRHDLGREKFVAKVWEWKEEYGGKILEQIRMLGDSVDWTRERFTMDEGLSKAVREVFVSLYEEGLVYKGDYIINWCNRCHTALADDEVEHEPRDSKLYLIKYPLAEDPERFITVATTRPETMLGDSAVAVHPEDERFTDFAGKQIALPLTDRTIPVIADEYVDMEFGTGGLKVTPAHDFNDWELGKKHGLAVISVLDDEGVVNENAPERFRGLHKEKARELVVKELEDAGLLVEIEDYANKVGVCYRCKSVIEPHVSTQWFVAVKPLAEKARAAVPGETNIYPENWTKTYYNWLDEIRDWCVSRQLWWGHRIPAFTCEKCGKLLVTREDPTNCPDCGGTVVQDEDVLDTWFSSALWPFTTLGWTGQKGAEIPEDLKLFYPTSVLVTAFDILFFWVARMMMMGIQFMGEVPFKDVYIHALVRDGEGKKMSKSTGNVIDPIDVIERFGTDALRFTLAAFAAMGRDIKLSEERIEGYRHFVNKLWNAARFALMKLPAAPKAFMDADLERATALHHRWILARLEEVKTEVAQAIAAYRFNDAAQALYKFTWHEFCDWYLEMVKPELDENADPAQKAVAQRVLFTALRELLVLIHPIMPFVSAEIWAYLPGQTDSDIATERYPEAREGCRDEGSVAAMSLLQETIVAVRAIRGELNIGPSVELALGVRPGSEEAAGILETNREMLVYLARLSSLTIGPDAPAPKASATAVVQGSECIVPLQGAVDLTAEVARLEKELGKVVKELTIVEKKLANEGFLANAPAEVVEKEKEKAAMLAEKQTTLETRATRFREALS